MAEHICRTLRDGTLEGELAVSLSIKDSLSSPFGFDAFDYFFANLSTNVSAQKSQACGIVLVAVDRSPLSYIELFKGRGVDASSSYKWLSILDCYSDPLGWKMKIHNSHSVPEESTAVKISIFRDLRDINKLLLMILKIGEGFIGERKGRFSVAIDSISTLLRHSSLPSVAKLISNLRSSECVSSIVWLIHSDLHEPRHSAALEYISTIVASLKPEIDCLNEEISPKNLLSLEHNLAGGKFLVRMKRRNGRVKILHETFYVEQGCITFAPVVSVESSKAAQNLVPKVQFNLQLSEKERADRAKVVLPFEHQGDGADIKIYDGRQSLSEDATASQSHHGKGEIHYIRDSDDELPDSDEDPDDDLDI